MVDDDELRARRAGKRKRNRKAIVLWALAGLLAVIYLMAGSSKLAGAEQHVSNFARWGWPDWMRIAVGTVEVTCAILLLVPRAAWVGAGGLVLVMSGATYTHLFRATGEGVMAMLTLLLGSLCVVLGWARRPRGTAGPSST